MPRLVQPLKCLAILLVLVLYGIPWYRTYFPHRPEGWGRVDLRPITPGRPDPDAEPFFIEHFVNEARPGVQCHVSAIEAAGPHRLICTWYAGSREGARDVAIYAAFFEEFPGTWSSPEQLLDRRQSAAELGRWVGKIGNAVVVNDHRGSLWLFYATLLGGWSTASLNYKVSRDCGRTWSPSRRLILSPFFNLTANVKNKGLPLTPDSYLLPVYHEFIRKFSQTLRFRADEADPCFELRRLAHSRGAIQPVFVPSGDQSLAAFFRPGRPGKSLILRAESRDAGQTWSSLTETSLPNPNAGFDIIRLNDGTLLGVVNPTFQDRSTLALAVSRDGGHTWEIRRVLEASPGREYSYPSLAQTARAIHVTYTYERSRIKHLMFNEAWLRGTHGRQ